MSIETMSIEKIEKIRSSYRPDEIRILFVGESPPKTGKFFYCGNSQMFEHMKRILRQELFQGIEDSDEAFFKAFKASGCYLDDLVLCPVSSAKKKIREAKCKAAIPDLAQRIRKYRPRVVVALLKRIECDVEKAVKEAGVTPPPCFRVTSFPGNECQDQFERDIQKHLPVLRDTIREYKC